MYLHHTFPPNGIDIHVRESEIGPYLLDPFYKATANGIQSGIHKLAELAPDQFYKSEYYKSYYVQTRRSTKSLPTPPPRTTFERCAGGDACADVCAGRVDPQGQGNHRGVVRSCLLGLVDLDDQQASGREPEGVCRAPACRALSLPSPRCPLREGARSRYSSSPAVLVGVGMAGDGRRQIWPWRWPIARAARPGESSCSA